MALYFTFSIILLVIAVYAAKLQPQTAGCCPLAKKSRAVANGGVKKFNIISAFLLAFLWFLTAFRATEIGNDTENYLDYFVRIRQTGVSNDYRIEYGFQVLCAVVGLFTDNQQIFLIVCATFCYLGVGVYIFKYSANVLFSTILVFCFCYSDFTNILRQDIAMVICLYAYQAIKNHKNILGLFLILLASTFHKSALVTVILFLHRFYKFDLKLFVICIAFLIFICISGIAEKVILFLASRYKGYFNSQYARTGWSAVAISVIKGVAFLSFINTAYFKNKKQDSIVFLCLSAYTVLSSLGFTVNLFTRAAGYFILPMLSEIPNACYCGRIKRKKLWLCLICFALLSYFIIVLILRPEWNHLYPYRFFWN